MKTKRNFLFGFQINKDPKHYYTKRGNLLKLNKGDIIDFLPINIFNQEDKLNFSKSMDIPIDIADEYLYFYICSKESYINACDIENLNIKYEGFIHPKDISTILYDLKAKPVKIYLPDKEKINNLGKDKKGNLYLDSDKIYKE